MTFIFIMLLGYEIYIYYAIENMCCAGKTLYFPLGEFVPC